MTYLAGKIEESEFLERASKHGYAKANAHYTIGMLRLAAGERPEAYNHFTQCVATNAVGSFDYELAKAYLARWTPTPPGRTGFQATWASSKKGNHGNDSFRRGPFRSQFVNQ